MAPKVKSVLKRPGKGLKGVSKGGSPAKGTKAFVKKKEEKFKPTTTQTYQQPEPQRNVAMTQEIYIDGIGKIDFIGGVIRMELVALESAGEGKDPQPQVRQKVVMPARGLLQSMAVMQNMVQKMVDAGVIQQQEGGAKSSKKVG